MVQSGIESVTMTIASLLVVRWFGPELLGQLAILLAGVQLITNVCDGFAMAIVRFVSRATLKDLNEGRITGWKLAWITGALHTGLSVFLGVAGWSIIGFNTDLTLIILAVFVATFRAGRTIFDSTLRAVKDFRTPSIAAVVCTPVMAILIIVLSAMGWGVAGYLLIMGVLTALNLLWITLGYRRNMSSDLSLKELEPRLTKDYLKYAFPLAMRGLSGFFFLKINIWMIGWLASVGDAGQFRLVDQFLTIPALVFSAVLTAVAPRVAELQESGRENLSKFFSKLYGLMMLLSLPVAVFFLFNKYLVNFLFPGFGLASTMLMVFTPVILIRGIANSASILLVQGGHPKAAFWLGFLPCVANLIFSLAGFYLGGVFGLVIGTAVVHFVTYFITVVYTHKIFQLPFRLSL